VSIIFRHSSVTFETWLGSVYTVQIYSQAELAVDHGHEISTFQHGLSTVYCASLHSDNTL